MAENILELAFEKAAEARESGAAEVGHYPMFWLEHIIKNRSWEKIELAAYRSFSRSLTDHEMRKFLKEVKAAKDDDQKSRRLQRRTFIYYSKVLWCRPTKQNPRAYKWDNPLEIEIVNPHLDGVPEDVKNEIQTFAEDLLPQRFIDEAISNLDPDND